MIVQEKTVSSNLIKNNQNDNDNTFRLDDEFVSKYSNSRPNFGFNGLGELVFYRTYSRLKSDNTKETFCDAIRRVVEGCYEIQRRHCKRLHIPWNYNKALESAKEMFQRIWDFKFTPPGRGLWMMGTEFMWERGSAALNNCFSGDTKYITRDGIKTLRDTVGTTQRVLSTGGKWVNAKIKSFGEQELLKITLHRGRHVKVIYATADHRWLVKSKSRSLAVAYGIEDTTKKPTYKIRQATTEELTPRTRLAVNFGAGISNNLRPSIVGIMHGICVGDGTTGSDDSNHGTYLYLCGDKDKQLLKYFSEFHITDAPERGESGAKRIADLPRFFRQMPNLSEATTYLYGWLAGYFAADGRISQHGSVQISSKNKSNLEVVKSVCAILGIGTHEITNGLHTIVRNGITKKYMQYRITLFADHLCDKFFLIDEHLKRFKEIRNSGRKKIPQYCYWVVDNVETTGIREEVYCAQVPEYHTFTLEGNILTGNCGFVSTDDLTESDPAEPFCFLMDMSMLGVGVGFDTKGANKILINKPSDNEINYVVPDSREGWVDSVRRLIRSYTTDYKDGYIVFDYTQIRPAGSVINGFGGKASGPGILNELHNAIRKHLDRCINNTLSSVDITDLMNYIGRCVVAGNVRRTAEIAFGDADDDAYASMKNYKKTLRSDEISKFEAVTGRLWAEALSKSKDNACPQGSISDFAETGIPFDRLKPAVDTWNMMNYSRWASNNSIFAKVGMDYNNISEQISVNGEPGLIWLDNVRDYGRMIDGRQPGIDGRVLGANPCFAGNMRLLTTNGYMRLDDLWLSSGCQEFNGTNNLEQYGMQKIVNRNGIVNATNVYRTGLNVDLYRVKFDDNLHIDATAQHTFIVIDKNNGKCSERRVKLSDLQVGQIIPLNQTVHFGEYHDPAYAELAGWCIGDGSLLLQKDGQIRAKCSVYENDIDVVLPRLSGLMNELYYKHTKSSIQTPQYIGWSRSQDNFKHSEKHIGSCVLGRLLRSDGVIPKNKHRIPNSIWSGTRETVAAFIRGLASADGYVNISDDTISIRISQSNYELLSCCKLLLNQFGIFSSIHLRSGPMKRMMNNGKGGKKLYSCKSKYELIISGIKQARNYIDSIGFIQNYKNAKARNWLDKHHGSNNSNTGLYTKISSIEYIGKGDTYCLTEPGNNQVVVEGYQVGQCMEQSLESYELCVSGDTKIQLRNGIRRIDSLIGQNVEIWNGDSWSNVVPRITGYNRTLYRVHLSDGSYLDTTENHGWSVRPVGKRVYRRVETKDLQNGDRICSFILGNISGRVEQFAFEMGYAIGDGYLDLVDRPRYTRPMAVVCGQKSKLQHLGMNGRWYKPQNKSGYNDPYNRINLQDCMTSNQLRELRDCDGGLPEWIMDMDRDSVLKFVAGWIESDGCIVKQKNTDGYRIYGLEAKIRDLQLLLRRIGINYSTVNLCHSAGQVTNKGVRKHDLWYVQIASFECGEIPTRVKIATRIGSRIRCNPKYRNSLIDMAKKQYVIAVEKLDGVHTTYCFDEPDNHMGVFGNSITYQCNLVETFPANHKDADDYMRTLKFAYLYAKSVTLLPTHNPRTNQVMLRNRRIGLSQSGIIQAFEKFGRRSVLRDFCDAGYNEIRRWDSIYADWLCVQKSIKVTSVKPSGTVSLVVGATPGIHYSEAMTYWRRVRIAKDSILVKILRDAGYHIEPVLSDPERTVVVKFAVDDRRIRSVNNVSIWEQVANAVDYQRYWADNQVSCTIKFKRSEINDIARVLECYEDQLKGISFLPLEDHGYAQAPYEPCTPEEVVEYNSKIKPADYSEYILEAIGSYFCDGEKCEIPVK